MSDAIKDIINQALELSAKERVIVVEQILLSLDQPDPDIDRLWQTETEARLDAHDRGELEISPVSDVIGKYDKHE